MQAIIYKTKHAYQLSRQPDRKVNVKNVNLDPDPDLDCKWKIQGALDLDHYQTIHVWEIQKDLSAGLGWVVRKSLVQNVVKYCQKMAKMTTFYFWFAYWSQGIVHSA